MTNLEVFELLDEAFKGLLWMSEFDYPFEVLNWELAEKVLLDNEVVLKITRYYLDTSIKVIEFDGFFNYKLY
ncbi:nuclease A inhibitor family protein [Trichodesmium erythraeum]|uniref:nuclease A inhibitor family protein n=1 Tax=Trichodesmium erythraeum TaxID=1206 RepID=UPI000039300F|nr:hypothetical protein [Trichodesmium erythraeum GBRTRLIN201]